RRPSDVADGPPKPAQRMRDRSARQERPQQRPAIGIAPRRWLAGMVVASTGFATFLYEITWSRVFATLLGPSTYAFAATVTGLIAGLAAGSTIGSFIAGRVRRPELPLALALVAAALGGSLAASYAGTLPLAF